MISLRRPWVACLAGDGGERDLEVVDRYHIRDISPSRQKERNKTEKASERRRGISKAHYLSPHLIPGFRERERWRNWRQKTSSFANVAKALGSWMELTTGDPEHKTKRRGSLSIKTSWRKTRINHIHRNTKNKKMPEIDPTKRKRISLCSSDKNSAESFISS